LRIKGYIIFALLTALLACLCACGEEEPYYEEGRRLLVTEGELSYGEGTVEEAAERFAALGAEFYSSFGVTADRGELKTVFKNSVLPALYEAEIYGGELLPLLSAVEESDGEEIYYSILYSVGAKRTGALLYSLSERWLSGQERTALEKHERTGLAFYLDDASRFATLRRDLTEDMGKESFTAAVNLLGYAASLPRAMRAGEGTPLLSAHELLFIADMQSEYFASAEISEEQWQILARLFTELTPPTTGSPMKAELYALKNSGYYMKAIKIMPSLISLYRAAVITARQEGRLDLSPDGELYESPEAAYAARLPALLSALLENERELELFLATAEAELATSDSRELAAIKEMKLTEAYASFSAEVQSADRAALTEKMLDARDGLCKPEELYATIRGYLFSIAPYLTFTLYYQP